MPFTLSHAAAVLPFRRYAPRSTSLSALVIGSMSPDFVYFYKLGISGWFSHSLAGIFLFCLPASLIVYVAFYLLVREPMIALMPEAFASRLPPRPDWVPDTVPAFLIVVGSFLAGALTHLAWDAFTHANTFAVKHFDALRMPVRLVDGVTLPMYKVLQHVSTVFGLAVLAAAARRWMRRTPPRFVRRHRLSLAMRTLVITGFLAAGMAGGIAGMTMRPARTFEHVVFNGVVAGIAWTAMAMFVFCACWRLRTLPKITGV